MSINTLSRRWKHKFQIKLGCWVFVPEDNVLASGKKIKEEIESAWNPPEYYFHLRNGGHVAALNSHLNSTVFIRADIHQFFNQINKSRVTRNLKKVFNSYSKASQYAEESTVRLPNCKEKKYILPFGFVQSAIIASICLRYSALESYLENLRDNGFLFSVYMDDIIISSRLSIDEMNVVYQNIINIADKSRFPLNLEKSDGASFSIKAFNIELSNNQLEISEQRLSQFQSALEQSDNQYQIDGILGYIKSVNPSQTKNIRDLG